MTSNKPQPLVPKLRFPEFVNAPQWQLSTFGERCESFSGGTPDTSKKTYYGGMIPFIRSAEIGSDETEIFLTKEGLENSAAKTVKRGDLLVALYGANSGDTALARIDGAINQAIMCLRSVESVPYLYYYLTSRKKWIITTYLQGGQGNLSGQIVLSVPVSIPHKDEQQKIADCLRSLDDLIAAEGRKLEALRQHKLGLMQQLFPQPGETVPRLRFPEFVHAGDWKTVRCRDIAKVLPGYGFPDKFQGNTKGQFPFYKVSDISYCIEEGKKYISDAKNYIESDILDEIRGKSVPKGTIIFAKIGEAIRSNRRVITTTPAVIDNNTAGITAKKTKIYDEFLFYLWSNVSLINYAGGVVPAVSKSALENVPLCYPINSKEQQRIADCLGSLDDLIAAEGQLTEALQQLKQGLMQQLFPCLESK